MAGRSGDGEFISVLRGSFFEWIGGWGYRGSLSSPPPFFLHDLRGLYASFLAYRILGLFSVLSQCLSIVLLGSEGFFPSGCICSCIYGFWTFTHLYFI